MTTTLDELKRNINDSIITARNSAMLFVEQEKIRRELAAKAAAEKEEMETFKAISPYLKKLPELMKDAGRKGLTCVRLELPQGDFKDYNGRTVNTPKNSSTTAKLMQYLVTAGLPIQTRIVELQHEDTGAYNERIIWHEYQLEVKF